MVPKIIKANPRNAKIFFLEDLKIAYCTFLRGFHNAPRVYFLKKKCAFQPPKVLIMSHHPAFHVSNGGAHS